MKGQSPTEGHIQIMIQNQNLNIREAHPPSSRIPLICRICSTCLFACEGYNTTSSPAPLHPIPPPHSDQCLKSLKSLLGVGIGLGSSPHSDQCLKSLVAAFFFLSLGQVHPIRCSSGRRKSSNGCGGDHITSKKGVEHRCRHRCSTCGGGDHG